MALSLHEEMLAVLESRFGIKRENVTLESRLNEDLDLDSIDLFDILGIIEEKTGVSVEATDFLQVKTFGDFLSTLQPLLSGATGK